MRDKSQEGEETRREKELTRGSKGTKDPIRRKGKTGNRESLGKQWAQEWGLRRARIRREKALNGQCAGK